MSQITPEHVEKLLQHWADEHARVWALYDAWHENQSGGFAGQVVDRTREGAARTLLTKKARAKVARRLILKGMRDKDEKGRIPAWAGGDPARCKETRSGGSPQFPMDAIAEQVDRWVSALWQWDPRAAMCLRAHYRLHLRTGEGADWVHEATELPVSRHGYIAGLARGRLNIARCAGEEMKIAS